MGLLCVQEDVDSRPSMATVVLMLSSYNVSLPLPKQSPFYFHSRIESQAPKGLELDKSRSKSVVMVSIDKASITQEPWKETGVAKDKQITQFLAFPFSFRPMQLCGTCGTIKATMRKSEPFLAALPEILKLVTSTFYFTRLYEKLNAYSRIKNPGLMEWMKRNYLSSPWSLVSVSILLLLTIIQSAFKKKQIEAIPEQESYLRKLCNIWGFIWNLHCPLYPSAIRPLALPALQSASPPSPFELFVYYIVVSVMEFDSYIINISVA
ncbi:hypothetical protein LguiB_027741 [Lonicera macranthoides]